MNSYSQVGFFSDTGLWICFCTIYLESFRGKTVSVGFLKSATQRIQFVLLYLRIWSYNCCFVFVKVYKIYNYKTPVGFCSLSSTSQLKGANIFAPKILPHCHHCTNCCFLFLQLWFVLLEKNSTLNSLCLYTYTLIKLIYFSCEGGSLG